MHRKTLAEQLAALNKKEISSVELTEHYLKRIKKHNDSLNCFVTVTEDIALAQAKKADEARAKGSTQPLLGLPMAHKDIFCTKNIPTRCGSKMMDNFVPPYESTTTQRCADAGMVLLGKTNMDEFAMGSSSENSFYGPTKNPWNLDYVPGGSSGGSASCVAGLLAPAATGTDTGGSIRQPAGFTGITGLKPTYGRLSRFGMIAFASSLDVGGPMTQTAEDAALLMNTMAGFDVNDSTSVDMPVPNYLETINQSLEGVRIGLPKEFFTQDLDKATATLLEDAIKTYQKLGAVIKTIELPSTQHAIPAYYVISPAECSSNLARYDGVRYGHRCENPKDLNDLYCRSRDEGFGEEVKRRILIGTHVLSAGYYDAFYIKAQKIRRMIKQDYVKAFESVDLILGPTTPTHAFKINEKKKNPVDMYLADCYTVPINLAGVPAISIPVGFDEDLPVGLQIIGNYFSEALILNAAHRYQQVTDWHQQHPKLFIED